MVEPGTTCWTVLKSTAAGDERAKQAFSRRYEPAVRAYLITRWPHEPMMNQIEAAVRAVFKQCFGKAAALQEVMKAHGGEFRSFLHGIVREVAQAQEANEGQSFDGEEGKIDTKFDRTWAQLLMRRAAARHSERAKDDNEQLRRLELLRLNYYGGMSLNTIAEMWRMSGEELTDQYKTARMEFQTALIEVAAYHHPRPKDEVQQECERLLALLAPEEKE